jgi:hypothetical protein
MLLASTRARALTSAVALLLLIPVVGIRLQTEDELARFHNRTLAQWPQSVEFRPDPPGYFRKAKQWLADRAYPIVDTARLHRKILYFILRTPPQRHVTIGKNGFIFLNGPSAGQLNGIFHSVCVQPHREGMGDIADKAMSGFSSFAARLGRPIDVVVVPTPATLYADQLPASVPKEYLDACQARMQGRSPLSSVGARPGVVFVYPLPAMLAASKDPAFFPKGNWHPQGLSLVTLRDAYLKAINRQTPVSERLELGVSPSEIMRTDGITQNLPIYFVRNEGVKALPEKSVRLSQSIGDLFRDPRVNTRVYSNSAPSTRESVLMLSDSYGEFASEVFAGAFSHLMQITVNGLPDANLAELIRRVDQLERVDRLILLIHEGSISRVITWSRIISPEAFASSGTASLPAGGR